MPLPDPWRYARPDTATHYVRLLADAPRRPLAIFGPRQIGKTYFLTHDVVELAEDRGWEPIYVDLWGQSDPLGAVNTALSTILRRASLSLGRNAVTSVGALGVSVGLAAPAPLATGPDAAATLAAQFAELVRLQPNKPALVMLDEAQTLTKPGVGDHAMKAVRALFNSHPGSILLIFTGSSKVQLMSLVGDHSKTAFKLAANMDFPTLGKSFVEFVADRYRQITQREIPTVELDWAFGQLLNRPGEMIDFVRFMITDMIDADVRTALEAFKQKNRADLSFQQLFDGCTPLQQALLLEVAANRKLFGRETRQSVASRVGAATPSAPATIHNALQQLEAKGVLVKSVQRGHYQFEDEHMRTWIDQVARHQVRTT